MAVQVYRCSHCGREVLVRIVAPLSEEEVSRRLAEELRPEASGPPHRPTGVERMRDDIWVGISGMREHVPRETLPDGCPACGRDSLVSTRVID